MLADVATRPWRTPHSRAADPRPSCTWEYVKDHAPQDVSLGTPLLYHKTAPIGSVEILSGNLLSFSNLKS